MTQQRTCIAGVLLAAGRSRRMGRLKQLLPWHRGRTVVESAFDSISPFCDCGMIVVAGHDANQIAAVLGSRPHAMVNSDSDAEMLVSVCAGLTHALDLSPTHVLLQPADHPDAPPHVVTTLTERAASRTLIPTYRGKGGHPACIPAPLIPRILEWRDEGGLREFWLRHASLVERVEFPDAPAITRDLDTPADYEAARKRPRD